MAIQMRRGALDKLDRSKLLPGEFAICEDGTVVICYATGKTKVVTSLELENARVSADGTVYETLKERLDQEYNQLTKELEEDISQLSEENAELKEELNEVKGQIGQGGSGNVSEGLKTILQRIQTEIKACIRDDSVCPNSYIDATDVLINNLGSGAGGGTDEPVEPNPPIEEPDVPVVPDTGWTSGTPYEFNWNDEGWMIYTSGTDGYKNPQTGYVVTQELPCNGASTISIKWTGYTNGVFLDENHAKVSIKQTNPNVTSIDVPSNAYYVRFCATSANSSKCSATPMA